MIVKVCGMRDAQNIKDIDALGVDWMGFIFYPKSPRYVDVQPSILPEHAKRVGVFVNETIDNIKRISNQYSLDIVQLHGNESPDMCFQLSESGLKVMKAFSVMNTFSTANVESYQQACQYFLFDTQTKNYGGSGKKFNWDILSDYQLDTPFLLSGGISVDDANSILALEHSQLLGIDINSQFEIEPALKDINMIKQFLNQIKNNE